MSEKICASCAIVVIMAGGPVASQTRDVVRDENSGIVLTYDPGSWVVLEPPDDVTVVMLGGGWKMETKLSGVLVVQCRTEFRRVRQHPPRSKIFALRWTQGALRRSAEVQRGR